MASPRTRRAALMSETARGAPVLCWPDQLLDRFRSTDLHLVWREDFRLHRQRTGALAAMTTKQRQTRRAPISRREAQSPSARAYVAIATMIERGQARTLAASMTDHIASSAGLYGIVVGRVPAVYVAEGEAAGAHDQGGRAAPGRIL